MLDIFYTICYHLYISYTNEVKQMQKQNLIFVRVTDEMKEQIKQYAKAQSRSMSSLILYLLNQELMKNS